MNEESYEFKRIEDRFSFEFESISKSKKVQKLIAFRLINSDLELYNIALVDIMSDGKASDLSISNNQDMPKVLATVFQAISYFLEHNQYAKVYIQGSTVARTRLYQMAISKYLDELEQKFILWGFFNNAFELFSKGKNYESFIVAKK